MIEYSGKLVLAPMVRIGHLPTRLLALKHGADLVWGPEIIDKKVIKLQRVVNNDLKTIDFIEPGERIKNNVAFRTCRELEQGKLVFQLGTADPQLAVQAAKIVANDVDAIDVNSGCPKHFSIHSGMGAALLKTPDKLVSILTSLVQQVGIPYKIPITVKIRLLEKKQETLALVERLAQTGVKCITVHCRLTEMRNRQAPLREDLKEIVELCHKFNVSCFVNGGVRDRIDYEILRRRYNVDGAMIASSAELNPSVFAKLTDEEMTNVENLYKEQKSGNYDYAAHPQIAGLKPWWAVAAEFCEEAIRFDNFVANTKYCLCRMIPGKEPLYRTVSQQKSNKAAAEVIAQYIKSISEPKDESGESGENAEKNETGKDDKNGKAQVQKDSGDLLEQSVNGMADSGLKRSAEKQEKLEELEELPQDKRIKVST